MSRYRNWNGRRGIAAYQVWNEANVTNFWTGTPLQMAQLTKATWNAVKSVDKGALVVSPAFAARINEQIRGITRFAFARVDGIPAWKFVDVMSLNLYPLDKYGSALGTPEKSMELLAKARRLLGFGGLPASKPIWNTEVNYGMRTGAYGGTRAARSRPSARPPTSSGRTCSTRPAESSGCSGTATTWGPCRPAGHSATRC